jgi:hypothetical protein
LSFYEAVAGLDESKWKEQTPVDAYQAGRLDTTFSDKSRRVSCKSNQEQLSPGMTIPCSIRIWSTSCSIIDYFILEQGHEYFIIEIEPSLADALAKIRPRQDQIIL